MIGTEKRVIARISRPKQEIVIALAFGKIVT
jgi:hypothetical protein